MPPVPCRTITALTIRPCAVAARRAERGVVHAKLGQRLAGAEAEIAQRDVAFGQPRRIIGLGERRRRHEQSEQGKKQAHHVLPVRRTALPVR